jgi:alpha-beta hydrolase superfamily lysophospholipase
VKRVARWIRRRPLLSLAIASVFGFAALNAVAYRHAYRMLHFTDGTGRTPRPEQLSIVERLGVLVGGVEISRPKNEQSPADFKLPSETVRFETADGLQLEGWRIPADDARGPDARGTVLLFHGYSASRDSLLPEAGQFRELGWTTLLVDHRGCGGSDGDYTTIGYREGADVAAALRWARENKLPAPYVLYGQSMGAAAVLRSVAACGAEPDGVILESTFNRMLDTVSNRFAMMGVPAFPAARLLVYWGGVQTGFDAFEHNPEEYARACRVPALMLHGEADLHARLAEGRAVFDNLAGPKEWLPFPNTPHTALQGADPARWRIGVSQFLDGLAAYAASERSSGMPNPGPMSIESPK